MEFLKKHWTQIVTAIVFLFIGWILSSIARDLSSFYLEKSISITDITNLILTVIVGVLIPLSLSPLLTDKRTKKDLVIQEIKDLLSSLTSIKESIDALALEGKTKEKDKLRLNSMISSLGLMVSSLYEQLSMTFGNKSNQISREIKESYINYWGDTTSGAFMSKKFVFDRSFCLSHDKSFSRFRTCLKKAIYQVNSY